MTFDESGRRYARHPGKLQRVNVAELGGHVAQERPLAEWFAGHALHELAGRKFTAVLVNVIA
jgi:hypothetical protein